MKKKSEALGVLDPRAKKLLLIMRLSIFLVLISVLASSASVYSQATKLTVKMKNCRIADVFDAIEQQSDFYFFYSRDNFDDNRLVSVDIEGKTVEKILDEIFEDQAISYEIVNKNILIKTTNKFPVTSDLQQKTVSGKVTDKSGQPLPGVTIMVKSTTQGTVTDIDGRYSLSKIPENAILVFSFVGMRPQEVVVESQTSINIAMEEDAIGLEEVVAIGYGTQKKRDIIGSIATIKSEEIMKATSAGSFDAALQGLAPGLMVSSESGVPGTPVQVKVRGVSSISSGTNPLWIIDGIPVASESVGNDFDGESGQNIMSLINPSDIESIEVLKDAAATSIYGSRGSNGVILITTKSGKKGALTVNVDLKSGVSNWANKDIGLASGSEFIEIMDRAYANSGRDGLYQPEHSLNQLDGADALMTRDEAMATNTNWADVISRTGSFIEANVSASQGTENGNSYLSLRYRKDNSILRYSDLQVFQPM